MGWEKLNPFGGNFDPLNAFSSVTSVATPEIIAGRQIPAGGFDWTKLTSPTSWYENPFVISAGIQSGLGLVNGLFGGSDTPYANTQAGFQAELDYKKAELAASQQIAAAHDAAQLAAAELAAGAAMGAAQKQYEATMKKIESDQKITAAGIQSNALSESIKQRIEAKWGKPEIQEKYAENAVKARQIQAAGTQLGFTNAAEVLTGARK